MQKYCPLKPFFFVELVKGGLAFILFFYNFFVKRIQWLKNRMFNNLKLIIPYIILLYIIVVSLTYLTFEIKYEVWLFLALMDYIEKNYAKNKGTNLDCLS